LHSSTHSILSLGVLFSAEMYIYIGHFIVCLLCCSYAVERSLIENPSKLTLSIFAQAGFRKKAHTVHEIFFDSSY